jgi:archaemetzincin
MAVIHLISLAYPEPHALAPLAAAISREIGLVVQPSAVDLDIAYAYDSIRRQYHSTRILLGLRKLAAAEDHILGVTAVDLFIPILTYVFGEAQLDGPAAVVSSFRLNPLLYGLERNNHLLNERLTKEAIHELGHTFGLRHCPQLQCVMHASTYAEEIDLKLTGFCPACKQTISRPLPPNADQPSLLNR